MRVALVHDYLNQYGGAERVLGAFCEIWPQAPIFTLLYDEKKTGRAFVGRKIKTSFLQKVPLVKSRHRSFLMLMPLAVEQFNLSKYDLVISDSASFAKGVITGPETLHICYCHTPTRYAWDDSHRYIEEFGYSGFVKKSIPFFMNYLRVWDEAAASRPDKFIANSACVAQRIKKYYGQEAAVIFPPADINQFNGFAGEPALSAGDYFLIVARLLPYKKVSLAIAAFNKLGWPLKIIGEGPEKKYLKKLAKRNIEFVGLTEDRELKRYYVNCRALIFPQEEDFGIVAVEAASCGRPVIAYRGGGSLEIIKEGATGIFFEEQTVDSLINALVRFESMKFDGRAIRQEALKYDKEVFKNKIKEFVAAQLNAARR